MKFDTIVGNPPYQEITSKKDTDNGQKAMTNIFQYFQELADNVSKGYISLIYPGSRWIHRSGKGMSKFGHSQINDAHLSKLLYFSDANEVFDKVEISDGISIVLKNMHQVKDSFDYEYHHNGIKKTAIIEHPGDKLIPLDPTNLAIINKIDKVVSENNWRFLNESVFSRKLFAIESDFVEKHPDKVRPIDEGNFDSENEIKLFTNDRAGKSGRAKWFIASRDVITMNQELIDEWQVVVSSANAGGQKRDNQIAIIDNHSAFGRSRLALKSFKTEQEAKNFLKYAQTTFIRYAFLLTNESLSSLAKQVPDIIDYTNENSGIDWTKSIQEIDQQLYRKYGLSNEEIDFIETKIKAMD